MAVVGEPLKRRHGVMLYSPQPTLDTPVTPAIAVGIATPRATSDTGMNVVFGLGTRSVLFMKPGLAQVPITITIDHLQSKAFLMRALASGGDVPLNTIGLGYIDDAGTKYGWQVDNCKIEQVELAVAAGGPVTATFTMTGDLITVLTTMVGVNLTQEPFKWYEGLLTKDAVGYEVEEFRATVNHNVTRHPVIRGTAATTRKRLARYSVAGYEDITGQFTRFDKTGVNLQADTQAPFDLALNFADAPLGTNIMNLTFDDCKFLSEDFDVGDDIRFSAPWRATTWGVA